MPIFRRPFALRVRMRLFICLLLASAGLPGCALLGGSRMQTVEVCVPDQQVLEVSEEARKKAAHAERLIDQGKLPQAERDLLQALQLAPHFGEAHNNLGLIFFQRRQLYDAAHSFQRAITFLPGIPEPHNNLGMVLEEADKPHEAIAAYEQAYLLNPVNPIFLGNLVRARVARGDCTDDLALLLQELIVVETRPEWVAWARDELYLMLPKVRREVELAAARATTPKDLQEKPADIPVVPPVLPHPVPELPPGKFPPPVPGNIPLTLETPLFSEPVEAPGSFQLAAPDENIPFAISQ